MATEPRKSAGAFDGALRWIGDLDHPFYNDERQRFVWYEASAIGFQLLLMLQAVIAGVTLLIFGNPAWKYVALALAPTVLTTLVIIAYASGRGAPYFATSSDLKRGRGVFAAIVGLLWGVGAIRAGAISGGDDFSWNFSTIAGFFTGIAFVAVGIYAGTRWQKRAAVKREVTTDLD